MSAVAEWVGEFLLELFIEVVGQGLIEGTGRILIWLTTGGRVRTRQRQSTSSLQLPDDVRDVSVSPGAAMFVGALFWILVALGLWWII